MVVHLARRLSPGASSREWLGPRRRPSFSTVSKKYAPRCQRCQNNHVARAEIRCECPLPTPSSAGSEPTSKSLKGQEEPFPPRRLSGREGSRAVLVGSPSPLMGPAHHHVDPTAAASAAHKPSGPIRHGGLGAVSLRRLCWVRLSLVSANPGTRRTGKVKKPASRPRRFVPRQGCRFAITTIGL
jgi:hypothetical protein